MVFVRLLARGFWRGSYSFYRFNVVVSWASLGEPGEPAGNDLQGAKGMNLPCRRTGHEIEFKSPPYTDAEHGTLSELL